MASIFFERVQEFVDAYVDLSKGSVRSEFVDGHYRLVFKDVSKCDVAVFISDSGSIKVEYDVERDDVTHYFRTEMCSWCTWKEDIGDRLYVEESKGLTQPCALAQEILDKLESILLMKNKTMIRTSGGKLEERVM